MDQGERVGEGGPEGRREVRLCTLAAQGQRDAQGPREEFQQEVVRHLTGQEAEPHEILYLRCTRAARDRRGARNCWVDAQLGQIEGLLPGDDLRGFSGRSQTGRNATIDFFMQSSMDSVRLRQKQRERYVNRILREAFGQAKYPFP